MRIQKWDAGGIALNVLCVAMLVFVLIAHMLGRRG